MRRFFCLLFLAEPVIAEIVTTMPLSAAASPAGIQELLLAIHVNQEDLHETALLLRKNGDLLADAVDIRHWRLSLPSKPSLSYQGHEHYPLAALRNEN